MHFPELVDQRKSAEQIRREALLVAENPLVDVLLSTVGGLVAILNEQRQVLALNHAFLASLGVADAALVLGLRPGEVVNCVHPQESAGGCGTTACCGTCGAAIAMAASLRSGRPEERRCAMTVNRNGQPCDICFSVRSAPLMLDGCRLLVLFLQDVTEAQNWAEAEHVLFHDLNNIAAALMGATSMVSEGRWPVTSRLTEEIHSLANRLADEIAVHQSLLRDRFAGFRQRRQQIVLADVFMEANVLAQHHPAARGRKLTLIQEVPLRPITTDPGVLMRVLENMLINAFEATPEGGEVRFWAEEQADGLALCVWNAGVIPADVARRVFQRYYSTKPGTGRGLGTYAMKLLGERILGGAVAFESTEQEGTIFRLVLPAAAESGAQAITGGGIGLESARGT